MAKKSKYEILLSNEIVERIDYIAKRRGSTRSATINRLLSEYLEIETDDSRLDRCFRELEMYFLTESTLFTSLYLPGQSVLLVGGKKGLGHCYEIELFEAEAQIRGEIRVHGEHFSPELKIRLEAFFGFLKLLENRYAQGYPIRYGRHGEAFTRSFFIEKWQRTEQVGVYIGMLDRMLKGYLTGIYTDKDLEQEYLQYRKEGMAEI